MVTADEVLLRGRTRMFANETSIEILIRFHKVKDGFETSGILGMRAGIVFQENWVVNEVDGHYREIMYVIFAINARSARSPLIESRRSL